MTTLDSPFPNQESSKKIMKIQMKAMLFLSNNSASPRKKSRDFSHPVDYKSF